MDKEPTEKLQQSKELPNAGVSTQEKSEEQKQAIIPNAKKAIEPAPASAAPMRVALKTLIERNCGTTGNLALTWEPGSPVIITMIRVVRDTATSSTSVAFTAQNISSKIVDTIRFRAKATFHNGTSQDISNVLLDQALIPGGAVNYGMANLENSEVDKIEVFVTEIIGPEIEWKYSGVSEPLPTPKPFDEMSNELVAERRSALEECGCSKVDAAIANKMVCEDDWWLCPCGQLNQGTCTCVACNASKERLSAVNDPESIAARIENRKAVAYEKAEEYETSSSISSLLKASKQFEALKDYRDASDRSKACKDLAMKKLRPILIGVGALIVAILLAAILTLNVFIPMSKISKGRAALEDGNYSLAAEFLIEADGFGDASDLLHQCGEAALAAEDYECAWHCFEECGDTNYANYCHGMVCYLNDENYDAIEFLEQTTVEEAEPILQDARYRVLVMQGNEAWNDHAYWEARDIYSQLPEGYSYAGVNPAQRVDQINKFNDLIYAAGTYHSNSGNMEVRSTHDRTGNWNNWTWDLSTGYSTTLSVELNDDGSATVSGTVEYIIPLNYSTIGTNLHTSNTSDAYSLTVWDGSTSFTANTSTYATLSFKGSWFEFRYHHVSSNEDAFFTYLYHTDLTYIK